MNQTQFYTVDYKRLLEREREVSSALWKYRTEWLNADAFQWVLVKSGKLPSPGSPVLVYFRELDEDDTPSCFGVDDEGGLIAIGVWEPTCKAFIVHNGTEPRVTHWRPLPVSPWTMQEGDGEVYQ